VSTGWDGIVLAGCPSVSVVLNRADAVEAIEVATQRLLRTVDRFSDQDIERPSLLPGWTRGHVLAHVALTADAMRNLLVWARTGVPVAAYASQAARDAAVEAGAGRSASALLSELSESAERFHSEVAAMPEQAWQRHVRVLAGAEFPAVQLPAAKPTPRSVAAVYSSPASSRTPINAEAATVV